MLSLQYHLCTAFPEANSGQFARRSSVIVRDVG